MNAEHPKDDFPVIQGAIYGVALSLDSLLLNGISYGVLQRAVFPGFLEITAGYLLRDLASLEALARENRVADQPKAKAILAELRTKCQELIDLVAGLNSFRTLSPGHLRCAVSQIPLLRGECVHRIGELEVCLGTPKPFYPSRPAHSTASINAFLANLEQMFNEERVASPIGAG